MPGGQVAEGARDPREEGHSMTESKLNDHFLAIWRRALNQTTLDSLTPDLIESWATARSLSVRHIEERDVGPFGRTKSIVLTLPEGSACFPKVAPSGDPVWEQRRRNADNAAA